MTSKFAVATALLFAFALLPTTGVLAKTPNKSQAQMKTCNAEAKTAGIKGAERKAFMKKCLSSGKAAEDKPVKAKKEKKEKKAAKTGGKPNAGQERMKSCNKEAAGLKGAERKAFMKKCLKKS